MGNWGYFTPISGNITLLLTGVWAQFVGVFFSDIICFPHWRFLIFVLASIELQGILIQVLHWHEYDEAKLVKIYTDFEYLESHVYVVCFWMMQMVPKLEFGILHIGVLTRLSHPKSGKHQWIQTDSEDCLWHKQTACQTMHFSIQRLNPKTQLTRPDFCNKMTLNYFLWNEQSTLSIPSHCG